MLCSVEEYDEVRFFVMLWYSLKLCDNNIEKLTLFWDKMRGIVSTTKQSTPCTSVQIAEGYNRLSTNRENSKVSDILDFVPTINSWDRYLSKSVQTVEIDLGYRTT